MFSGLRKYVKKSVVVYMKDGQALEGVLFANYKDSIQLTSVNVAGPKGGTDLPGELLILKENLRYLQYTDTSK